MKYIIYSTLLYSFLAAAHYGRAQTRPQDPTIEPYFGPLFSILGVYSPVWGIGIEAGIKTKSFYAGAEYGVNGIDGFGTDTRFHPQGYQPSPSPFEDFLGVHGGAVISNSIFLGLVFLYNYQIPPYGGTGKWFNLGADLRYQFSDHFMLSTSYTIRRGLTSGICVIVW